MKPSEINQPLSERQQKVVDTLLGLGIDFDIKFHPPLGSIEESLAYWGKFEATHCKNLFSGTTKATSTTSSSSSACTRWTSTTSSSVCTKAS